MLGGGRRGQPVDAADGQPRSPARWFAWPNMLVPLAGADTSPPRSALFTWRAFHGKRDAAPFLGGVGLFADVVPGHRHQPVPDDRAAATTRCGRRRLRPKARRPSCWSARCSLLPVILGYTAWSYWVFRGKVTEDSGYH